MKKIIIIFSMLVLLFLPGCSQATSADENPGWVQDLVASYEKEPVGNPPQSIWQYDYKGSIVYYVPPQCCDQFSKLYAQSGEVICAPDGGFTGQGDGKCSDFNQEKKNGKLIWKDPRTP